MNYTKLLKYIPDVAATSYLFYYFNKKEDVTLIDPTIEKIVIENYYASVDVTEDVKNTVQKINQFSSKLGKNVKIGKIYLHNNIFNDDAHVVGINNDLIIGGRYLFSLENIRKFADNEEIIKDYQLDGKDKFYNSRDFVLAHELSHIYYQDTRNHLIVVTLYLISNFLRTMYDIRGFRGLFPSILMVAHLTIGFKRDEKKADMKALEILGDNKSAIHTFENIMRRNINLKNNKKNWRNYFISKNGDNYLDFSHPLLSTRLNYVKNIK
jgi:hypothetical protein